MEPLGAAPEADFDDIEWRLDSQPYARESSPTKYVARFVPYLNATTIAGLLDAWVGPEAWTDEYRPVDFAGLHGLECAITINGVTKRDVGVSPGGDSDMATKGIYSDAFKRCACIKWGVGRNVYKVEGVWAPVESVDKGGKQTARAVPASMESIRSQFDRRMAEAEF